MNRIRVPWPKVFSNMPPRWVLGVTAGLLLSAPAYAQQGGGDPWDNAVDVLKTAFTGPIPTGLSLAAIVVGGVMFAFGEGQSKRVFAGIVLASVWLWEPWTSWCGFSPVDSPRALEPSLQGDESSSDDPGSGVATKSSYKDKKSGEYVSRTEWHRVMACGKLGEFASSLKKGRTSSSRASCAAASTPTRRTQT